MSDLLNPVSAEEESLSFDMPDVPARESKYFYAAGKYRARCVDIEKGFTKPKEGATQGDPKVVLSYILLEGPGQGVSMKQHLPITGAMFWRLEKTADALGVPFEKGSKKIDLPRGKIVGTDVTLELVQSNFGGKDRMEIKNVLKAEPLPGALPL
jgi:hypothetical protein